MTVFATPQSDEEEKNLRLKAEDEHFPASLW